MKNIILITGCSSGFGLLFTKSLALKGHVIYASMRNITGKNAKIAEELRIFAQEKKVDIHVIDIDVTDEASADSAVESIISEHGHIDVLINNAGISSLGVMEAYSMDDFRRVFDVNVMGTFLLTRKVIPHMRERKNGLIINQSSSLGRFTIPLTSVYNASKWAIEALTESWNYEFKEFNIDSVMLEAGVFPNTDMRNKAKQYAPSNEEVIYEYEEMLRVMLNYMKVMKVWQDKDLIVPPEVVAEKVCELVDSEPGSRPLRVLIDPIHEEALNLFSPHYKKMQEFVLRGVDLEKYSELI
ncbi:MAG: SDR family oxidoreductase [Chitinophagales bacterium]|nr:SDR family oxidoreductase [Chitinophagales bacterium]